VAWTYFISGLALLILATVLIWKPIFKKVLRIEDKIKNKNTPAEELKTRRIEISEEEKIESTK
jgi:membrane protein implicated in regulation of membrane protease activity